LCQTTTCLIWKKFQNHEDVFVFRQMKRFQKLEDLLEGNIVLITLKIKNKKMSLCRLDCFSKLFLQKQIF